jgi:hypothetical protein
MEKCGILPKGPKYIRKYVCSSLAIARQRVHDSYPRKPTMRNSYQLFGNQEVIKYFSVTPCSGQEMMEESILTLCEEADVKKKGFSSHMIIKIPKS